MGPEPGAVSTRNGMRTEWVGQPSSCAPTVILYLYCTRRPAKDGGPPAGIVSLYSTARNVWGGGKGEEGRGKNISSPHGCDICVSLLDTRSVLLRLES